MSNVIDLNKFKNNLEMELVIGKHDGSIDNASIPVRWCLTKKLLDKINDSGYYSPQICIQVEYLTKVEYYSKTDEYVAYQDERHLFSLNQFIAYVPLSRPGRIRINAYILGIREGELGCYGKGILRKDDYDRYSCDYLDTKTKIFVNSTKLRKSIIIDIIAKALEYDLIIPKDIFGKKPPQWILDLINRYQDTYLVDQCQLRRRYMFFPIKLLFIIPEAVIRESSTLIALLALVMFGYVQLPWSYLKHPLIYSILSIDRDDLQHYVETIDWSGDIENWDLLKRGLKVVYRVPLIWLFSIVIIAALKPLISSITLPMIQSWILMILSPLIIYVFVIVIIAVIMVGIQIGKWIGRGIPIKSITKEKIKYWFCMPFIFIGRLCDRLIIKLEDWENERNKADLLKMERYLTCNNDPHSVTADVDEIPFKDRTITLIYYNIKNKVCKPLSR